MPCRSDWMEPTFQELESIRVAKLLIYVRGSLEMPVIKSVMDAANSLYGDKDKLDSMTAELCGIMKNLSLSTQKVLMRDIHDPIQRDLANWWDNHQKIDLEREQKEKDLSEIEKVKQQALSKLSPEEIKALGIT